MPVEPTSSATPSLPTAIVPVILSGGAGTRLWPLSREKYPKQLLPVCSERSLLQDTVSRGQASPIVICADDQRFIVADQLRDMGVEPRAVVVEPVGRNTAPAVAVAALVLEAEPGALMLVMPSDHTIADQESFLRAVELAAPYASDGRLVTFGIQPTSPNTGYGYIRRGISLGDGVHAIARFVEKPDLATAQDYLDSGEYYWNAGIFLFSPKALLAELDRYCPGLTDACRAALAQGVKDIGFLRLAHDQFAAIHGQSIDYAVMERTDKAAVVPVDMGWSDVGTWSALWQESAKSAEGNVLKGDVDALDSRNCYVRSEHRLVTTVGVENLVVVETADAVLVANRERDQDVKQVVERLKRRNRPEATENRRVHRPWGWFETIDERERFRVKHIKVRPGGALSLQRHRFRSEHWVVVVGTAKVTCGDQTFLLEANQSAFIPAGTVHRLENPGTEPLRMIEVQCGDYVGEDDIERLEDSYGRVG